MKKNVLIRILSIVMLCGLPSVVGAATITVNSLGAPKTDCNPNETTGYTYYLPDDGHYTHPADDFRVKGGNALILRDGSSIDIWRGERDKVLTDCNKWQRISDFVGSGDKVVAFRVAANGPDADRCVFNIPDYTKNEETAENIDAQIHFSIGWGAIKDGGRKSTKAPLYYVYRGEDKYHCYPSGKVTPDSNNCEQISVKYDIKEPHVGECQNYTLFWCGDGLVNGRKNGKEITYYDNGPYPEECDPKASEWENREDGRSCNNSCKIVEPDEPICSSTYNNTTKYTPTSGLWLTGGTANLCDTGSVDKFTYAGTPRVYAWNCKNGYKTTSPSCTAKQIWCGDGEVNGNETCDDGEKNGTNESSCSKTCTTVGSATCGPLGGDIKYFSAQQTAPWHTKSSTGMCPEGLEVGTPYITGTDSHEEWTCSNANGTSKTCKAYQEYCGDGKKNGDEQCDYNDSVDKGGKEEGWGNDGCDMSCNQKNEVVSSCTVENTFHYKLRQNYKYTFWDVFDARDADRRLFGDPEVIFIEQKDFNRGDNPTFRWTNRNSEKKMARNTSGKILESTPEYHILDVPDVRTGNNLYIEYSIKYANSKTAPESRRKTHKECVFYEISWCGDGEVDKDWDGKKNDEPGEECDPEAEPWKTNHRCDPVTCKEKEPVIGYPDIKKTLKNKILVEKTGQVLKWEIKVTALSGDVDGFEVDDFVPSALQYIEYTGVSNPDNLTISGPTGPKPTETGNVYTWTLTGTLHSGNSYIFEVTTEVIKMPTSGDDHRNVACVIKNDKTLDCDDDKPLMPDLRIKKYHLNADGSTGKDRKTVKVGEEIAYKIAFGNSGNASATITSIKDFLPKNVEYVSSAIYIVQGDRSFELSGSEVIDTNRKVDGVYVDIYGGITLAPKTEGYIILTGKVLSENQDNRTNFACIYWNDKKIDCDDVSHDIENPQDGVSCSSKDFKITPLSLSYTGGSAEVSCSTSPQGKPAAIIEIDCGSGSIGNRYHTGSNISSLTGVCKYPENTSATAAKYKVQCKVNNVVSIGCAGNVSVNSKTTPKVSCIPTLNGSYVNPVCEDDKSTFSTTATCRSTSSADIQILCDGTVVKTGHTTELTGTCSANTNNTGHRVQCMVNGSLTGSDGKACEATFSRSTKPCGGPSSTSHCKAPKHNNGTFTCESDGNAYAVGIECNSNLNKSPQIIKSEEIKDGKMKPLTVSAECSTNNTVTCYIKKSSNSEWETEPSCKWSPIGPGPGPDPDPDTESDYCARHPTAKGCELGDPHCFNINAGNFSIESGEYLPFYFNIYRPKGSRNKKADEPESMYKFVRGSDENEECDPGTIDLSSMKCNYLIENPYGEVVYSSGGINCMEDETEIKNPSLINSWIDQQNKDYYINVLYIGPGKYRPHIEYTDSSKWKNTNDVLGEYKFKVELREYEWCAADDKGNGKWETVKIPHKDAAVCQSNFVLTDSYTVQKTPSGNLTASTDTLSKFKEADGNKISFSNYLNAIAASDYKPNTKVNGAMEAFINKYKKLAVKVDIENSFLESKVSVSKVPGKHIYFVDGDITVKGGSKNIETPFTIVQTSGTTIVKGDVNHNMMLLTKGDIKFKGDCISNQNVKGIFYAQGVLIRDGVKKNDSLKNNVRCTQGGLNIKGVLIGNNFNSLMTKSRSHLETWFKKGSKTTKVMNGASVVIEYSPSIFNKSTMPPGAEDFTTALSIYKQ